MATDETPQRRRVISDPASAARVSETDADQAVSVYREDAPPALRALLEAEPKEERR